MEFEKQRNKWTFFMSIGALLCSGGLFIINATSSGTGLYYNIDSRVAKVEAEVIANKALIEKFDEDARQREENIELHFKDDVFRTDKELSEIRQDLHDLTEKVHRTQQDTNSKVTKLLFGLAKSGAIELEDLQDHVSQD